MILLTAVTDKVSIITSATCAIDVISCWADNAAGTISFGNTKAAITTATTTDVVPVPGSSTTRNVQYINVRNKHATAACVVTMQLAYGASSATLAELISITLQAGESLIYTEALGWVPYTVSQQSYFKVLTADDTAGQAVNTVQPWFPTNGTLTVQAGKTYKMEGLLKLTHGATSHSTGLSIGGTATLTSLDYYAQAHRSAADTIISVFSGIHIASAANATVDVAGTQAATYIMINGILRSNAAGTIIPQFTFSANPTGTITAKRNSFFRLTELGDNTVAASAGWS